MAKFKVGDKVTWKTITGSPRLGTVLAVWEDESRPQPGYSVAEEDTELVLGILEFQLSKDE